MKRRLIILLPFLLLLILTANTAYVCWSQNLQPTPRHVSGFILVAANAVLYFFRFRYARIFTGIILILATFTLAGFTLAIDYDSYGLNIGGLKLSTPDIQWSAFGLLIFYLLANSSSIRRQIENRGIKRALLLEKMVDDSYFIAILEGTDCKTISSFLKEIGVALKFPSYYGQNMNALYECINDLEWVEKQNYLLVIKNSGKFLEKEPADRKSEIIAGLERVCEQWANVLNHEGEEAFRKMADFKLRLL